MESCDGETTDVTRNLDLIPVKASVGNSLLNRVEHIERKTFPANEVFDFSTELNKRNTQLFCAFYTPGGESKSRESSITESHSDKETIILVGYLVIARTGRTALLHKVCVDTQYRRRGVGKWMIQEALEGLRKRKCERVALWVDVERVAARSLYTGCGFEVVQRVEGYYAPGRTGVKMALVL
jgi:ribosomal protein S18 acetylase RimI-like enzyme